MRLPAGCGGVIGGTQEKEKVLEALIPQGSVANLYDRLAPVYDFWAHLTESKARNRAIELAEIKDGENLLEVAVGTGLAFYEIVNRNPNGTNTGIDLSEGMLSKARRRMKSLPHENYRLEIGTAFHLDMEAESVDTLVNNYMFDLVSFEEMDKIILEFNRVLKKSGKLILVNMTEAERFGAGLYKWIYRLSPKLVGGCRGITLSERLQKNGFRIDVREYHQQMLFPSEVLRAYK